MRRFIPFVASFLSAALLAVGLPQLHALRADFRAGGHVNVAWQESVVHYEPCLDMRAGTTEAHSLGLGSVENRGKPPLAGR